MALSRREALGALAMGGAGTLIGPAGLAGAEGARRGDKRLAPFEPGQHAPRELGFDRKKLRGISEKLIASHWENNYVGAVKNLNHVEKELARIGKDTPGFLVSGLKERELGFSNSIIWHEHYFGNLGGDGKTGGAIATALAETYGSVGRWEEIFRATGASMGGGSGWAVLEWNLHAGTLRTYWSGNHTQAVALGAPLLVMDMYEHAYQMDYGAAAGKYIDAFMQNVDWAEVNRRFERTAKLGSLFAPAGK